MTAERVLLNMAIKLLIIITLIILYWYFSVATEALSHELAVLKQDERCVSTNCMDPCVHGNKFEAQNDMKQKHPWRLTDEHGTESWRFGSDHVPFHFGVKLVGAPALNFPVVKPWWHHHRTWGFGTSCQWTCSGRSGSWGSLVCVFSKPEMDVSQFPGL